MREVHDALKGMRAEMNATEEALSHFKQGEGVVIVGTLGAGHRRLYAMLHKAKRHHAKCAEVEYPNDKEKQAEEETLEWVETLTLAFWASVGKSFPRANKVGPSERAIISGWQVALKAPTTARVRVTIVDPSDQTAVA